MFPEPPWIAAVATISFGEVEHDATGCAFDLIRCLGAVLPELRDHGAQSANELQRNIMSNQHVFLLVFTVRGETPSADDLLGWAPPVATDPRQDP